MLTLKPFFQGKLAREEATSAFLAMLLDGLSSFRAHFMAQLPVEPDAVPRGPHIVSTEVREVDVRVDYPAMDAVILIENKVLASSVSPGQLLRYYREQFDAQPSTRVVLVYLGPGKGVGRGEVRRVAESEEFRGRSKDTVCRIGCCCGVCLG